MPWIHFSDIFIQAAVSQFPSSLVEAVLPHSSDYNVDLDTDANWKRKEMSLRGVSIHVLCFVFFWYVKSATICISWSSGRPIFGRQGCHTSSFGEQMSPLITPKPSSVSPCTNCINSILDWYQHHTLWIKLCIVCTCTLACLCTSWIRLFCLRGISVHFLQSLKVQRHFPHRQACAMPIKGDFIWS